MESMVPAGKIEKLLKSMEKKIELLVFTSLTKDGYRQCPACEDTIQLIKSISKLTDKLDYKEYSVIEDKDFSQKYGVDRTPTIIIKDLNIRYTGAPIGLETAPFLQTIIMASTGNNILGDYIDDYVKSIKGGKILVLVTPTCPFCAQAVLMINALSLAVQSKIHVEIVESYENPDVAKKWNVTSVPTIIINDKERVIGVPNISFLIKKLTENKTSIDQIYT
ncbi:MAG: thioredoxin family protein [Promethearchaeota archaeon]